MTVQVTQISMALEVVWPSDTHVATGFNLDLGHPCGLWWEHEPQTDHDCGRTKDTDMVLGSSPGSNVTMVPGDNTGQSDWHGSNSIIAL